MNAPQPAPLFAAVELAPRDPILGVTEAFNADKNPSKVNLGVGVYCDDDGKVPLLECVRHAERELTAKATPRGYLPIDGIPAYDKAVQALLFGADSEVVASGRAVTVQAIGGTGALTVGADFLKRFAPGAAVWISDPSWENHRALFEAAGFAVHTYPYYDPATRGLDFDAMIAALDRLPAGSIVVLHACCHNPTGADLTPAQWERVVATVRARGLVPFLDLAYQGFGDGLDADGAAVRRFAATAGPAAGRELVLEVVLALRRAHRRADPRRREQGRGRPRAVAGQAGDPLELFEPADARRPDRLDDPDLGRAARAVGSRARDHARPHQAGARAAGRDAARARSPMPTSASCSRSAACSRTPG